MSFLLFFIFSTLSAWVLRTQHIRRKETSAKYTSTHFTFALNKSYFTFKSQNSFTQKKRFLSFIIESNTLKIEKKKVMISFCVLDFAYNALTLSTMIQTPSALNGQRFESNTETRTTSFSSKYHVFVRSSVIVWRPDRNMENESC